MKKHIIGLCLLAGLVSATGFSAANSSTAQKDNSDSKFGLGLSTFGTGSSFPSAPALSASLEFGQKNSLQMMVGINNSDPLDFSIGSVYRYTLFGNNNLGWHIGVGFNLGTAGKASVAGSSSDFFVNLLLPTTGLKFSLGGALSNVNLCFDGGMVMHLTPSPFKMYMAPLNSLLGASIHYYF